MKAASYISRGAEEGAFPGAAWIVGGSKGILDQGVTGVLGANWGIGWLLAGRGNSAGTSLWIDPTVDRYAVLLTNRVHPSRNNDRIIRCRQIFHNLVILNYT
ncbi:hypothetical protein AGMMS50255_8240 [Spirochaetia bacterium]|nr:hypothetical protein AGMMS50255_8240 [Spirochaetia bacterium]